MKSWWILASGIRAPSVPPGARCRPAIPGHDGPGRGETTPPRPLVPVAEAIFLNDLTTANSWAIGTADVRCFQKMSGTLSLSARGARLRPALLFQESLELALGVL